MTKARVDIFSAGLNMVDTLRATLASVKAQTREDWTFTYVDLGSDEDSRRFIEEAAARDARVRFTRLPSTMRALSYNQAARPSQAEYIAFLDPDDCWQPGFLAALVPLLDRHPAATLAYAGARPVNPQGEELAEPRNDPFPPAETPTDLRVRLLFELNIILCPSSVLIRRTAFQAAGGWPEGFPYPYLIDDNTLWLRLAKAGPFVACSDLLVDYLCRQGSSSQLIAAPGREEVNRLLYLQGLFRYDLIPPLDPITRKRFIESHVGLLMKVLMGPPLADAVARIPSAAGLLLKMIGKFPEAWTLRMIAAGVRSRL